jgi:hypothetical protein
MNNTQCDALERNDRFLHSQKLAARCVKLCSIFSVSANISSETYTTEGGYQESVKKN